MKTSRFRVGAMAEWILAAGAVAGALLLGAAMLREVRSGRTLVPVVAGAPAVPEPPAAVPPGSVSVPLLLLGRGHEIRVGDLVARIHRELGATAQVGADVFDAAGGRERITRVYEYMGTRFVLVLEGPGQAAQARVAAIYLP